MKENFRQRTSYREAEPKQEMFKTDERTFSKIQNVKEQRDMLKDRKLFPVQK